MAIPTEDKLRGFPEMFLVAFALRCARRVQPLLRVDWPNAPVGYVNEVETWLTTAERMTIDPSSYYHGMFSSAANGLGDHHDIPKQALALNSVFCSALSSASFAIRPYKDYTHSSYPEEESYDDGAMDGVWLSETIKLAHSTAETVSRLLRSDSDILFDFSILKEESIKPVGSGLRGVPRSMIPSFFALNSTFDTKEKDKESRTIIEVVSFVNSALIDKLAKHPREMYRLTPRQFEEVVAELFAGFDFEVELTAQTRDGGRDIIAINHNLVNTKYLIECKHYEEHGRVGVTAVRSLHGVVSDEGATKGIIATTASGFTKPAREHLERNKWVLEGRAFDDLVAWLEDYQRWKLQRLH